MWVKEFHSQFVLPFDGHRVGEVIRPVLHVGQLSRQLDGSAGRRVGAGGGPGGVGRRGSTRNEGHFTEKLVHFGSRDQAVLKEETKCVRIGRIEKQFEEPSWLGITRKESLNSLPSDMWPRKVIDLRWLDEKLTCPPFGPMQFFSEHVSS